MRSSNLALTLIAITLGLVLLGWIGLQCNPGATAQLQANISRAIPVRVIVVDSDGVEHVFVPEVPVPTATPGPTPPPPTITATPTPVPPGDGGGGSSSGRFMIFQTHPTVPEGQAGHILWQFVLSRDPVPDFPITQREKDEFLFNRGNSRWQDGPGAHPMGPANSDRIGYDTAYACLNHEDPGFHPYLCALRMQWQQYGTNQGGLINDQGMREDPFGAGRETQGLPPYAYEPGQTSAVDLGRPCPCVIELLHLRGGNGTAAASRGQVLTTFTIPNDGQMRWYYQLGGLFVGIHNDLGITTRIIISGMHPAYTYRIQGVPTGCC